jgi:hypothetical protein
MQVGYLVVYLDGTYDFLLQKPQRLSGVIVEFPLSVSFKELLDKLRNPVSRSHERDADHNHCH